MNNLAVALKEGKLMGASDGSVKDGKGSHAWIITPGTEEKIKTSIRGSGPVDGHLDHMNSTRAERAGFIGPFMNTLHIAQEFNITTGTLHMHVDNTGSYRKGNAPKMGDGTFRHVISDYDLKLHKYSLEHKLKTDHNITVEYHHVKAHQDTTPVKDTKGKAVSLTKAAKLNIICDKMAEEERNKPTPGHEPKLNPEMAINTKIYFESKGIVNINKLCVQIHKHTHEDAQIKYLKEKNGWDQHTFDTIDWNAHERAFKSLTECELFDVSKVMHRWLPVNTRLNKFDCADNPSSNCPVCTKAQETHQYLYQCQHFSSKNARNKEFEKLKKWRGGSKMSPRVFHPFL